MVTPTSRDTSQKLFHPPNYPGLQPRKAGVTRCLASAQAARAAGHELAPPPAGVTTLGPLYLGPAPARVRRTCQAAQRLTHAGLYCPGRLPTPWLTLGTDCPTAACSAGALLSIGGSFAVPPAYIRDFPQGTGTVTMWEAPDRQLRRGGVPYGCGGALPNAQARLINHTSFRGHSATWYRCPGGGPVMLEWHIDRESYGITADGPAALRRRLVRYIAKHLLALRPR